MRIPGAEEEAKMAKPRESRLRRRGLVPAGTGFVRHLVLSAWHPPRRVCRRQPRFSLCLDCFHLPRQKRDHRIAPRLRSPRPSRAKVAAELTSFPVSNPWVARLRCANSYPRQAKHRGQVELTALTLV